ncbi:MAG: class II aldolase/adducin family protein [Bacteroidales bacterium]|nr:class II aldolase/adducin family protein [Bacteroidales bacterium]MBN2756886.1 class II aldolase/adducin family protein [Bacteroidales bacterium]
MEIENIKEKLCFAGKKLLTEGLVKGTWGNISIRIDEKNMFITPSGQNYENLIADDMVLVNFTDYSFKGNKKPSSELKLHGEIYKKRKDVNAIIHTHQQNATTLAAARVNLPPIIDDMAQILGPNVKVTQYTLAGTNRFAKKALKALKGRNAVLLANHGAVVVGRNIDEAFVAAQVLEKAAKSFIEASFIGGAKSINKFQAWMMHKYFLEKYSKQK